MPSLTAYTPLESLLLFQALRAHDVASISFAKISNELKAIPLVRNDPAYDSDRLGADALKELYLGLLKDEAKRDVEKEGLGKEDASCVETSPGSRKRKAPSPSLPTVQDAVQHSHLIPRLVYRLYARYREKVIAEIREEERIYDRLNKEILEIENGEWDDKLGQPKVNGQAVPVPSTTSGTNHATLPAEIRAQEPSRPGEAPEIEQKTDQGPSPSSRADQTKIANVINRGSEATAPVESPSQKKASTVTALPPLSEMAPESPRPLSRQTSQQAHPPPLPGAHGYVQSPPVGHQSPYASQYPLAVAGASPSPRLQNVQLGMSPSSPRPMLPIPPGMKMQPQSLVMPNGVANHRQQPPMQPHLPQQYPSPNQRLPPVPMPPVDRRGSRGFQAPHLPTPPGYHHPYPPQYQGQPQYTPQPQPQQHPQQPSQYPIRPPHQGGIQLPPFQVAAQEPNKAHQQQLAQQAAVQQRPPPATPGARPPIPGGYPPYSPYHQPVHQPQTQPHQQHRPELVRAVSSVPAKSQKLLRPTWKASPRPAAAPRSPSPPAVEPLSPMKKVVKPSKRKVEPEAAEDSAKEEVEEMQPPGPDEEASKVGPRKSTRRTRRGSAASSAVASSVRGRTRSQSVMSHLGDHPPQESSVGGRRVKDEPATPAEGAGDESVMEETPMPTRTTRGRRAPAQPATTSTSKRKRPASPSPAPEEQSPAPEHDEPEPQPAPTPARPTTVLASRNFPRMSTVIMDEIRANKYANYFQAPVREKDAEGYFEIIKRPQDLKSIKAAIAAGSRAIAAATTSSTMDSPSASGVGTPSAKDGMIVLERSADLMPPKAIINSSQLEKEVLRMFANAVMFNPGDEGIVSDTREMAEEIEAKIRDWRGAERPVGVPEKEEEDEGKTPVVQGKRRKL